MSESLWSHGLQLTRLLCPLLSPRLYSNSCLLSQWCHPTISFSITPSPALNLPQLQGLFQWVSPLHQVAKVLELQFQHQSFQWIFRVDFLQDWDLLAVQGTQEFSPAPQFKNINFLPLSLLHGPTLTSIHDYWKDHSLHYMGLCRQSDVSAF